MRKSKTTISDIAKYLSISASTVSRALNNHELINDKTKEDVKNAARLLNYRPNQHARSLQTGKSGLLGLLLPHLKSRFYQQIHLAVEQAAQAQGQQVLISFSQDSYTKEQKCLEFFEQLQIDGLVVVAAESTKNYEHFELFQEQTPLVFISRRAPMLNVSMLLSNDRQGSYDAARYFIDQSRRKLAFMGYDSSLPNIKEREKGFKDALLDVQMELPKEWTYSGSLSNQAGYDFAQRLAKQNKFPDAVLFGDAEAAVGWLAFCQEAGISVPDQVGLMAWNETQYCTFFRPSISTITQKGFEMGILASEILFNHIQKKVAIEPTLKLFRPQLTHRASSIIKNMDKQVANRPQIDNQHPSA